MSQSRDPVPDGFIPFGGDDIVFDDWRPNACYSCGRSMSEKWGTSPCPFCVGESDE